MSTKKNTGVRNHNPNVAPTQAGSEVTVNPSAVIPAIATPPAAGTIPAGTAPRTNPWILVNIAATTYRSAHATALADFSAALRELAGQATPGTQMVPAPRIEAAGLYAELLRDYPDLTAKVRADVIEAELAVNATLSMVKDDFNKVLPTVVSCGREAAVGGWADASMVRSAAKALPHKDPALTARIASIEALLRRGKRVTVSVNAAAKAQAKALKTQQRAAQQVARATAKAAKAARTGARTVQVHAENHPLTGDVVIVPAGSTTPVTPTPTDPTGTPPKG